jgi:hypothetical protein
MGLFFAWMIGESIVFYRWGKLHAPPTPGVLASSSIVFGALAVASLYQPAKTAATVAAFTYDLAILMQVVGKAPTQTTGWPPPPITDVGAIMPPGKQAGAQSGSTGTGSGASPSAPASKNWWQALTGIV